MSQQSADFGFMPRRNAEAAPRTHVDTANERRSVYQYLTLLIERTAWFAAALLVGAGLACAFGDAAFGAATIAWLGLIAAAALLLIGASVRGARAPAREATIKAYTLGFSGTLVYAGATWGAGAFLAGLGSNTLILLIFSTAMVLAAVALLRERMPILSFSLPSLAITTTAAVIGSGVMEGFLVAAGGACILAAAEIAARLAEPKDPTLTLS